MSALQTGGKTMMGIRWLVLALALGVVLPPAVPVRAQTARAPKAGGAKVGPVPKAVRAGWKLEAYYVKYANAGGVPVVASKAVDDEALVVAADIVQKMLARRPDVLKALAGARIRVAIIGKDEETTDLPEYAGLRAKADYWNK